MGKLDGKVALITGAARGQGRAHAVTMAGEGADIAAVDICQDLPYPRYSLAKPDDLIETVGLIRQLGRRALARCGYGAAMRDATASTVTAAKVTR